MYRTWRRGTLLNEFGGIVPLSMLRWTESVVRVEMFQSEVGIGPVKLLKPKPSTDKLDNMPKDDGIAPDIMFSWSSSCWRLVRLPKMVVCHQIICSCINTNIQSPASYLKSKESHLGFC